MHIYYMKQVIFPLQTLSQSQNRLSTALNDIRNFYKIKTNKFIGPSKIDKAIYKSFNIYNHLLNSDKVEYCYIHSGSIIINKIIFDSEILLHFIYSFSVTQMKDFTK